MALNSGVAFGIPIGGWWWQLLILPIIFWLWKKDKFKLTSGLSLVLVGGFMNLWERLVRGVVVDIFELPIIHLWINFADILITIGCIIYIWQNLKSSSRTKI